MRSRTTVLAPPDTERRATGEDLLSVQGDSGIFGIAPLREVDKGIPVLSLILSWLQINLHRIVPAEDELQVLHRRTRRDTSNPED